MHTPSVVVISLTNRCICILYTLRAGLLDISDAFPECVAVSKRVHTNSYGGKSVVGSGGSNNNTRLNDQLMNKNVSTGSSSPYVISGLKSPPSLVSHDSFVFGEKSEPEVCILTPHSSSFHHCGH